MVPTSESRKTAIQAPASRGTEPSVLCTRTSTAGAARSLDKKRSASGDMLGPFAPPAGGLARSRCQNGQAAHVGLQRGGHGNAAVFALVVLEHGHQRAADRQA